MNIPYVEIYSLRLSRDTPWRLAQVSTEQVLNKWFFEFNQMVTNILSCYFPPSRKPILQMKYT